MDSVKDVKKRVRETIWRIMEEKGIARFPRPVYGRIPNFVGAEEAALRLSRTGFWRRACVVKVNPDSPQQPVRYRALLEGKVVVMATPRLRSGFLLLDPRVIPRDRLRYASTIRGAFNYGRLVSLQEIPRIDLVVTGCVAVDKWGGRVGKGGGYAELEYAILRMIGVIDDSVYVVTTIHDLQFIDEKIPLEKHDLAIDVIFTPTRTVYVEPRPSKPDRVYWDLLGDKRDLDVIRELYALVKRKQGI